jgi:hypothetical protein
LKRDIVKKSLIAQDVFSVLADRYSSNIFRAVYSGLKASSTNYIGGLSKKQFYTRLKNLVLLGLIEKRDSFYRTTTFGSLIYNSQIKTMDGVVDSYWKLKSVDVLGRREDFPSEQKDTIVAEILKSTGNYKTITGKHLTGIEIVKNFDNLVNKVLKLLENAKKEVYFATRYHQPDVSNKTFETFGRGVGIHILDGNPEQISLENRLNAIIRTPPNRHTLDLINQIVRSPQFDLMRLPNLPISFMVVDGIHVIYETANYSNPEQFTTALAIYNDEVEAQRFIDYFSSLTKNAHIPKLLQLARPT